MSYTFAKHRTAESVPTLRATSQESVAPSMDALRMGAAPTQAQLGHRVDLPGAIQAKMENAFGADLSGVKLYESQTVAAAGANAVAQGNTIAFAPGKLDFASTAGQSLLGHELSHVMSQARGEVSGRGFLNDHALEARADREGAMAAAGESVYAGPVTAPLSAASAAPAAGPMQANKKTKISEPTLVHQGGLTPEQAQAAEQQVKDQKKHEYFNANNAVFGNALLADSMQAGRFFHAGSKEDNERRLAAINKLGAVDAPRLQDFNASMKQAKNKTLPDVDPSMRSEEANLRLGNLAQQYSSRNLSKKGNLETEGISLYDTLMRHGTIMSNLKSRQNPAGASRERSIDMLNQFGFYRMKGALSGGQAVNPDRQELPVMEQTAKEMADYMFSMKEKYGLNLHNYDTDALYTPGDTTNKYAQMKDELTSSAGVAQFLSKYDKAYDRDDPRMQEAIVLGKYYTTALQRATDRESSFTQGGRDVSNSEQEEYNISNEEFQQVMEQLHGFNSSEEQQELFRRRHL